MSGVCHHFVCSVRILLSGNLLLKNISSQLIVTTFILPKNGFFLCVCPYLPSQNYIIDEISERDLLHPTKEEVLENLKYQTVIDVRRIIVGRGEKVFLTNYIITDCHSHILHAKIKVAYISCPVTPYMLNILRYFKCQRYGNSKISCGRCSVVFVYTAQKSTTAIKFLKTLKVVLTLRVITLYLQDLPYIIT